jgi:hypothetical protein
MQQLIGWQQCTTSFIKFVVAPSFSGNLTSHSGSASLAAFGNVSVLLGAGVLSGTGDSSPPLFMLCKWCLASGLSQFLDHGLRPLWQQWFHFGSFSFTCSLPSTGLTDRLPNSSSTSWIAASNIALSNSVLTDYSKTNLLSLTDTYVKLILWESPNLFHIPAPLVRESRLS